MSRFVISEIKSCAECVFKDVVSPTCAHPDFGKNKEAVPLDGTFHKDCPLKVFDQARDILNEAAKGTEDEEIYRLCVADINMALEDSDYPDEKLTEEEIDYIRRHLDLPWSETLRILAEEIIEKRE
jgi:hypothetical protein